jgi:cytochrome c oxidase cbb3-type subunit III
VGNGPQGGTVKRLIVAVGLLLILAVAGVLIAQARAQRARFLMAPADTIPSDPGLLSYAMARGAPAYAEHCVACHGDKMQGDPERAVPNLADDDWLYGTGRVTEIEHVILYGIRSGNSRGWDLAHMPAYATPHPYNLYAIASLAPGEIVDVTTYVLSLQHPQANAAAVERGKHVFHDTSKGNCTDCHGSDAKGDSAIGAPDLTDRTWLRGDGSRQTIEDSISYGLAGRCPAWSAELSPVTIRALAVYVHMKGGRRKLE